MRRVTCTHCRRSFSEDDEAWDRASATGACPNCGSLLDSASEQHAAMESLNPSVRSHSRNIRLTSLVLGIGSLAAAVILFFAGLRRWFLCLIFSASQFGTAIFFTPQAAARRRQHRRTDLTRFTEEQEAPRR